MCRIGMNPGKHTVSCQLLAIVPLRTGRQHFQPVVDQHRKIIFSFMAIVLHGAWNIEKRAFASPNTFHW